MGARICAPAAEGNAGILGLGTYRPRRVVDNEEACRFIDSSDAWIRRRTGIVTRHWADDDETLEMMGEAAASKAVAAAGIDPARIDCVIAATFTHMLQTPSAAASIAHRLGARRAAAFDLSAGCAGFVHGVAVAADAVRSRGAHVLVVGVERMTDLISPRDRSTAFIFGDGAGAVVVGPAAEPGIGPVVWGADGSQAALITQTRPWTALRDAVGKASGNPSEDSSGGSSGGAFPHMVQEGQSVFRWAVTEMPEVGRRALAASGLTVEDLDAFVPHQANVRIIDAIAARIGLPGTVAVARDVARSGNTSGASVPLAMDQLLASGEAEAGDTALLLGYGAGLSYAGLVVTLPGVG
ncbi:beta-ketoacyl-ACP synthase III [Kitasatospora sp. NPDC058115]|uniref:beta-ketoacyl-ACP synthase III n=1 Tax=Kitasatospora sp. NPDC058115 TaxID=3346347 RepID=UPI0036DE030B